IQRVSIGAHHGSHRWVGKSSLVAKLIYRSGALTRSGHVSESLPRYIHQYQGKAENVCLNSEVPRLLRGDGGAGNWRAFSHGCALPRRFWHHPAHLCPAGPKTLEGETSAYCMQRRRKRWPSLHNSQREMKVLTAIQDEVRGSFSGLLVRTIILANAETP